MTQANMTNGAVMKAVIICSAILVCMMLVNILMMPETPTVDVPTAEEIAKFVVIPNANQFL